MEIALTPEGMAFALHRHVLEPWFPRCLDTEHGGFLCDFDSRWRPAGPQVKMLEFQARQTRVAALAARLDPGEPAWRDACRRGFDALSERLWDHEHGGWFIVADRAWTPLDPDVKHLHGMAYAAQACLEVADCLDEPRALDLAREAMTWIDDHAWDAEHGLYWGWLRRDGTPIGLDPDSAPTRLDHVGAPAGTKDINTNGDMLEMLTEAGRRGLGSADRLARLVAEFTRWPAEHGRLPLHFTRDLVPVRGPGVGYEVQASWRVPLARAVLGEPLAFGPTERTLRAGTLASLGPTGGILGHTGDEEWWIQFELLRSLAFEASLDPEGGDAPRAAAADHLGYLRRRFLDERHPGVRRTPRRLLGREAKGDRWKDASHEAVAFAAAAICLQPRGRPMTIADGPWP